MIRGWMLFLCLFLVNFSCAYLACTDSDGGNVSTVRGNVSLYSSSPPPMVFYDTCFLYGSPTSVCNGADCRIKEYYCVDSGDVYYEGYFIADCSDCIDARCIESTPTPTCSDGIKNQDESDIDCGGETCYYCDNGEGCLYNSDCFSNFCSDGECATEPVVPTDKAMVKRGNDDPGNFETSLLFDVVVMQLEISNEGDEEIELVNAYFKLSGTGDDRKISTIKAYRDMNKNGELESTDVLIDAVVVSVDDGDNQLLDFSGQDLGGGVVLDFLIVYDFKDNVEEDETYAIEFKDVAYYNMNEDYFLATADEIVKNRITIGGIDDNSCSNGIWDTHLGETGIDCGGNCEDCSDICSFDEDCQMGRVCVDGDCVDIDLLGTGCVDASVTCSLVGLPLCDNTNQRVYTCAQNGLLTFLVADYDSICSQNRVCLPGDIICDHGLRTVTNCVEGEWMLSNSIEEYDLKCGEGFLCDPSDRESVYCFEDMIPYRCNQEGSFEIISSDEGITCEEFLCNSGEIMCDYENEVLKSCIPGEGWVDVSSEGSMFYAESSRGPEGEVDFFNGLCMGQNICQNEGEKRCGILDGLMEICSKGEWELMDNSEEEFNQICSGIDCRSGWFSCNPFKKEVSFCQAGVWGASTKNNYEYYCNPDIITFGAGPRIVTGEIVDNGIVGHKWISGPKTSDGSFINELNKYSYLIIGAVILVLVILVIVFAVKSHYASKYASAVMTKRK
ncbi:MAG: hypothetical protein WC548_04715 [Candidatus Pacearchaeota archaeon]